MKRTSPITLCALLLALLCACAAAPGTPMSAGTPSVPDNTPLTSAQVSSTVPPQAEPTAAPSPKPEQTPDATPAPEWQALYTTFLESNYAAINEIYYGPPIGLGFIDLDIDTVPEMILFDGGASASLGVEIFDIVDGQVTCISAAIVPQNTDLFTGPYFQDISINANYFEDFRLMYDQESGLYHFWICSSNGALDFSYWEDIVFRNAGRNEDPGKDGLLELYSALYKFEEYDTETGEVTEARYRVGDQSADVSEYDNMAQLLQSHRQDMEYEAKGVFIWNNDSYTDGSDGYSRLIADAIQAYVPLPDKVYETYKDWHYFD